MSDLIQQHRAATLAGLGLLLFMTAVLSGFWLRQGLRAGVTWMDGSLGLWFKPRRTDTPALYWFAIACHVGMTTLLGLSSIALFAWGLSSAL